VIGLTQTLALEGGEYNIRVNCIAPGAVEGKRIENVLKARAEATGLTYEAVKIKENEGAALGRMVIATEIADAAVFLVSDESSGITGQTLTVNAGSRLRA
jgi:NAD(P)-dependent dehydrogenase (short-subunit alcohol dehydrogenase family)